jgi:hypothetical protein
MAKKKRKSRKRLSTRLQHYASVFPDVILEYAIIKGQHVLTFQPGWRFGCADRRIYVYSTVPSIAWGPGKPPHWVKGFAPGWFSKHIHYIEPCDCDHCVGSDRGSALAIWRHFGWCPDWPGHDGGSRGALLASVNAARTHAALITDEDLVMLDQWHEQHDTPVPPASGWLATTRKGEEDEG